MNKVIFFTGAGISADAGIPTFQNQDGIRAKLTRSYANTNPEDYRATIQMMKDACDKAEPTVAHIAIAEADYTVITMNIDKLHTRAGSKKVTEVHGVLPTQEQLDDEHFAAEYRGIVLYDDMAPMYPTAHKMVGTLTSDDFFIIVGTSFYTGISIDLLRIAQSKHTKGVVINDNASEKVPNVCNLLKQISESDDKEQKNNLYQEILKMGMTLTEARKAYDPYYNPDGLPHTPYYWG